MPAPTTITSHGPGGTRASLPWETWSARATARRHRGAACGSLNLGSDLFKREILEIGTFHCVLDGESANIPLGIDVKLGVFVKLLCLADAPGPELDIQGYTGYRCRGST